LWLYLKGKLLAKGIVILWDTQGVNKGRRLSRAIYPA
jgi:hypothetical protein